MLAPARLLSEESYTVPGKHALPYLGLAENLLLGPGPPGS